MDRRQSSIFHLQLRHTSIGAKWSCVRPTLAHCMRRRFLTFMTVRRWGGWKLDKLLSDAFLLCYHPQYKFHCQFHWQMFHVKVWALCSFKCEKFAVFVGVYLCLCILYLVVLCRLSTVLQSWSLSCFLWLITRFRVLFHSVRISGSPLFTLLTHSQTCCNIITEHFVRPNITVFLLWVTFCFQCFAP